MKVDIGNLCTTCGRDTAFGSGELLFVNRIPSDGFDATLVLHTGCEIPVTVEGYMCPDCQDESD